MQRSLQIIFIGIIILLAGCKNESPVAENKIVDKNIPVTIVTLKKEVIRESYLLSGVFTT